MPTTCSTALLASATTTRPVKASERWSIAIAGVSALTNQSETKAAPTPATTSNVVASHSGQAPFRSGSSVGGREGVPPDSDIGMLAMNTINSTTAHAILSTSSCPAAGVCSPLVRVGTINAATASMVSVPIMRGASELKRCTPWRIPPTKKANPSTSRLLPRIEPTSAACTTASSPARSAKMATNSSGRLPMADCSTPVAPGPSRSPNCSVAVLTSAASSANAMPAITRVSTAPPPA